MAEELKARMALQLPDTLNTGVRDRAREVGVGYSLWVRAAMRAALDHPDAQAFEKALKHEIDEQAERDRIRIAVSVNKRYGSRKGGNDNGTLL